MSCRKRKRDDQVLYNIASAANQSPGHFSIPYFTDNQKTTTVSASSSQAFSSDRERGEKKLLSKARKLNNSYGVVRQPSLSSSPGALRCQSMTDGNFFEHFRGYKETKVRNESDIGACHICHRKPMQKKELGFYTNCERCSQRTCWICIRECMGLGVSEEHGENLDYEMEWSQEIYHDISKPKDHDKIICSQCCVEKGAEGEVWCLGCLEAEKCG